MISAELNKIIESAVSATGYELVGCEMAQQQGRTVLRVFVDGPEGITLDGCAEVSRQLGAVLDVEEPISGRFDLEVSSPGLDRPLFSLAHYQQYVGHNVKLRLRLAKDNRRNFVGKISEVQGDQIIVELEDSKQVTLNFNEIDRANLIPEL